MRFIYTLMASIYFHLFLIYCLVFIISCSTSAQTRPRGLIVPVSKDVSTLQYMIKIKQRTPLVPVKLTLDLGGRFVWVDCDQDYNTSTYRSVPCNSAQCSLAKSTRCMSVCYAPPYKPGCTNNTCLKIPENTVTSAATTGTLGSDVVSVQSVTGTPVTISRFLFVCGSTYLLQNLASGVRGMAGLARTNVSLPSQFFSAFSLKRKFGLCLSSTSSSLFFGEFNSSTAPLTYTPLLTNPISTASSSNEEGEPSSDYFIGVKSIKINNKVVHIDTDLLSIDTTYGYNGTKISTIIPYTVLHTSIYNAVVEAFVKEIKVPRVKAVAPFGACFSSKNINTAYTGPAVPTIDLVLQNKDVYWRIYGRNSMVRVSNEVLCLGFVDSGADYKTSIVIGGHQAEDNLLEFDIASSKMGFSPLLFRKQSCANFKFATPNA